MRRTAPRAEDAARLRLVADYSSSSQNYGRRRRWVVLDNKHELESSDLAASSNLSRPEGGNVALSLSYTIVSSRRVLETRVPFASMEIHDAINIILVLPPARVRFLRVFLAMFLGYIYLAALARSVAGWVTGELQSMCRTKK